MESTHETMTGAENIIWDLSDLYTSVSDPAFINDMDTIADRCQHFQSCWKGKLASSSPSAFAEALSGYEALIENFDKMGSYAQLIWSTDTEDPKNGHLLQMVRERLMAANRYLVFFSLETGALPEHVFDKLLHAPELEHRKHWLELVRTHRKHQLSEEVEQALSLTSLSSRMAWVRLHDELSNAQVFRLHGQEYTEAQVLKLLHESNRTIRKEAAESISVGLKEMIRSQAFIFNTVVSDQAIQDSLRGYPRWISSRNMANEATDASVDALIAAVVERYPLVRRFYALKKRILGLDTFYDYDRYAPVAQESDFWTWEQAKDIVLTAYNRFDTRIGNIAAMFFEKNWIHAPVRKGKNGGAYSAGTTASVHPYVFMNYTGTNRDVQTLAHELGHGVHQYLSRSQGNLLMDTPLTVAETASVFGEIITFNSLFTEAQSQQQKLSMLVNKLDDIISTVFRQIALNRFENAMHETRRSEGELSVDRLCELWLQTQSEQFGDAVVLTEGYKYWWSYISHFMHAPGYVYAYAYGELLVLALHEIYKQDPASFPEKYIAMLSSGGAKSPTDLLAPFGINVEDPNFWNVGLDVIERVLTDAEELHASITT